MERPPMSAEGRAYLSDSGTSEDSDQDDEIDDMQVKAPQQQQQPQHHDSLHAAHGKENGHGAGAATNGQAHTHHNSSSNHDSSSDGGGGGGGNSSSSSSHRGHSDAGSHHDASMLNGAAAAATAAASGGYLSAADSDGTSASSDDDEAEPAAHSTAQQQPASHAHNSSSSSNGGSSNANSSSSRKHVLTIDTADIPPGPPEGVAIPEPLTAQELAARDRRQHMDAAASAYIKAEHSSSDASPAAAAAPSGPPEPPPKPLAAQLIPCMLGQLAVEQSSGDHVAAGRWGMSRNAHRPDAPANATSPFEFRRPAAALNGAALPASGAYEGHFLVRAPPKPDKKAMERDLQLHFVRNTMGGWNVDGQGSNEYGHFTVSGTLQPDGSLELYRQYMVAVKPKPTPAPKTSRSRDPAAAPHATAAAPTPGGKRKAGVMGPPAPVAPAHMGTLQRRESFTDGPDDGSGGTTPRRRVSKTASRFFDEDSPPVPLSEPLKKCSNLLKQLSNVKNQSHWFREPVDPEAMNLPNYRIVIRHPMDLGTIKTKLEGGEYSTSAEFAADVRLVFANALTFNPVPKDPVHIAAKDLSNMFENKFAALGQLEDAKQQQPPQLKRRKSVTGASSAGGSFVRSDQVIPAGTMGGKRKSTGGSSAGGKRPRAAAPTHAYPDYIPASAADPVHASQMAEMQRQMLMMQETILRLQQQQSHGGPAHAHALPPPAASASPEPMEDGEDSAAAAAQQQQHALPLPHAAAAAAAAASGGDGQQPMGLLGPPPLSFEEKRQLSQNIDKLQPAQLSRVVSIIHARMPNMSSDADDEIELDIDAMDIPTLRELQIYVTNCLEQNRRSSSKRRGSSTQLYHADDSGSEDEWA